MSTPKEVRYSLVVPGYPKIKVKSPFWYPFIETGRKLLG